MLILAMLLSMVPASVSFAASGYDFQPEGADNTANSMKMLEPADITLLTVNETYYLNKINTEIDGTKDIRFAFTMSAGMNNFNEDGFLTNNMPLIKICDESGKIVAEYSEGKGDLKFGGSRLTDETNNHGSKKTDRIYLDVAQGVLSSGTYVLVFGKDLCGNNTSKKLGKDIKFQFKVKAAPPLADMIQQAETFLQSAATDDTGMVPDTWTESAKIALQEAIDAAKAEKERIEADGNLSDAQKKEAEDMASDVLYNAFEAFREARCVIVDKVAVSAPGEVWVGDRGTASAAVTVRPDEDQYKKVTWTCSDNLIIDPVSGAWQANFSGNGWIKATSGKDPEKFDTCEFQVKTEPGVMTVNLYGKDIRLKDMVEKALAAEGQSSAGVKTLKVFTAGDGAVTEADWSYIRENLTGLTSLNMKTAATEEMPVAAFSGNKTLQTVVLPDALTKIPQQAFYNCTELHDIEIPPAVVSIGGAAFAGCTAMKETLIIHAVQPPVYTTTSTKGDVFDGVAGTDTPSSVRNISVPYGCSADYKSQQGWRAFSITERDRQSLTVNVTASGTLQQAAAAALQTKGISETQVTDLIITSSQGVQLSRSEDINGYLQTHFLYATTLDLSGTEFEDTKCNANTFKDRISMKYMRLPDNTTTIGGTCFAGCKNLRDMVLPESLGNIGNGAFSGCDRLGDRIVVEAEEPPTYSGTIFPESITTIVVPPQSIKKYQAAAGWNQYRDHIISQITLSLNTKSISMQAPATRTLRAEPGKYGGDPDDVSVIWSSDNASVAKVSPETGNTTTVTALKPGRAIITAKAAGGYVTESCTVTITALSAPRTVKATAVAYNKVKLTWGGVSGADSYEIYRSLKKNSGYTRLRTLSASARSYVDTRVNTGTAYYYKVRASRKESGVSYAGAYSAVTGAKPTLPKATGIKVKKDSKQKLKVTWKKVTGANGYTVYRSLKKNKSYKAVKTLKGVKSVSYTTGKLKKGKTYYFKVRAYRTIKGKKIYGAWSSVASRKCR